MAQIIYQPKARCFGCCEPIEERDLVFAAICGHETCASTTWHYHHLMQAREVAEQAERTGGNLNAAMLHLLEVLRG